MAEGLEVAPQAPAQVQAQAPAAPVAAPAAPASAPEAAPAEAPKQDAFAVAMKASDERYRKLQAAKDREIAELSRQLQAIQAAPVPQVQSNVIQMPANPNAVAPAQEQKPKFSGKQFLDMIDSHNEEEAVSLLLGEAERRAEERIMNRLRSEQSEREFQNRYLANLDAVNAQMSTTGEEQNAMVEVIRGSIQNGRPTITPHEALMTVRFGGPEQALSILQQAARASAQTAQPAQPAPPVPGFSLSSAIQAAASAQQQQPQKQRLNLEGLYRSF
jgi:hypothetical protein